LLKNIPENKREKKIFDIVNQLNFSIGKITLLGAEKENLAKLNFRAGIKAKLSLAYETAFEYMKIAQNLLQENSWLKKYLSFFW